MARRSGAYRIGQELITGRPSLESHPCQSRRSRKGSLACSGCAFRIGTRELQVADSNPSPVSDITVSWAGSNDHAARHAPRITSVSPRCRPNSPGWWRRRVPTPVADGRHDLRNAAITPGAVSVRGFDPHRSRLEHHGASGGILILPPGAELSDWWRRKP